MSSSTTVDDLPASLRLKILSFLPIQEAIKASLISPDWRNLWYSLTSLSFEPTPSTTSVESFFHFITNTLIRRPAATLSTLHLNFPITPETLRYKFDITSYINYAVNNNLSYLNLTFSSKYFTDDGISYDFPLYALKLSSVNKLYLTNCNLYLGASVLGTNQFSSLNTLYLEGVYLTDALLVDLVKLCGNLDDLTIMRCNGMKHIRICSLKLKRFAIWFFECDDGSLEISAPTLCNLGIYFCDVGRLSLVPTSSLVEGCIFFSQEEKNYRCWSKVMRFFTHSHVKKLCCQNWGYKAVMDKDLFPRCPSFSNLSSLKLDTGYSMSDLLGMAALLEQSPNLETIFLGRGLKLYDEAFEEVPEEFYNLKLSLPRLRELKFDCYWGEEADLYFLKLFLRDQVALERIILFPINKLGGIKARNVVIAKYANVLHVVEGSFAIEDIL